MKEQTRIIFEIVLNRTCDKFKCNLMYKYILINPLGKINKDFDIQIKKATNRTF